MLKIGTVGLGAWGWNLTRSFAELKGCELISCFDLIPSGATRFKIMAGH